MDQRQHRLHIDVAETLPARSHRAGVREHQVYGLVADAVFQRSRRAVVHRVVRQHFDLVDVTFGERGKLIGLFRLARGGEYTRAALGVTAHMFEANAPIGAGDQNGLHMASIRKRTATPRTWGRERRAAS